MAYETSFGEISEREGERPSAPGRFRIALLGDFSGRVNRGDDTPLGERKPLKVDYDSLDEVLESLEVSLRIPIAGGASFVEVEIEEMDDFHPDQLFAKLEIIDEVLGLARRVDRKPDKAIPLITGWGASADAPGQHAMDAGGSYLPRADALAELAGWAPSATVPEDADTLEGNELLAKLVGPYVRDLGDDADAEAVRDAVQRAGDGLLREIMHHPDFRALESSWRGLEWLLRRTAKGDGARVVLFDVGAVEFAADLADTASLDDSGLFDRLVKQTAEGLDGDPWCAVLGLYHFDVLAPHADLLGRMAKIAHRLHAPFLTGVSSRLLAEGLKLDEALEVTWDALRALPESAYLSLSAPGFLLRLPYGEDAEETDNFPFEELRSGDDAASYLWGNAGLAATALIAQDFVTAGGWNFTPGKNLRLGNMTMHSYRDEDGDGVAVVVQKRVLSSVAEKFTALGPMVLSAERGTDVALFAAINSLNAAEKSLLGPWGAEGGSSAPSFAMAASGVAVGAVAGMSGASSDAGGDAGDAGGAGEAGDSAGDDLDSLLDDLGGDDEGGDDEGGDDGGGDDDLDALLGDLGSGDDDGGDDDLDALLSDLDSGGDNDSDDDLDALLGDLDSGDEDGGDDDLDALLSDLDSGDDDDGGDDLDALLSDLDSDDGDEDDLDALLKGLDDD